MPSRKTIGGTETSERGTKLRTPEVPEFAGNVKFNVTNSHGTTPCEASCITCEY